MIRQFPAVLLLISLATVCVRAQDAREVVLAARRTPVVEVIDATTLDTIARLHFDARVERVRASANAGVIFVDVLDPGCCKNYLLDIPRMQLNGNTDREYLGYSLRSPDGHWGFTPKSFRGPALTSVNLDTKETFELVPAGLQAENSDGSWDVTGTWSKDRFYYYVAGTSHPGFLWTVLPGARQLGTGVLVDPFNAAPGCDRYLPVSRALVAAEGGLLIYEPFGSKADRTGACQTQLPGGAWKLDPATGHFTGYIAPEFHFNVLRASQSGSTLYGADPGSANWSGPVRLVTLDSRNGAILKTRSFDPGVLQISVGHVRGVPTGDVQVLSRRAGD